MSELKKIHDSLNSPLLRNIFFILFILITFMLLYGSEIPFLRPQSVHQWRQSDSASYALNYYQNNKGMFNPQTMNLAGKEGRVVSEFPIIYYWASKCYKWFGMQEVYLRLISYLFFASGLFFLFRLSLKLFENRFLWAFVPPLFLVSAPYISYYALNFLPNVPALGMTLAAWYFYYKWWKKERSLDLWIGMAFMALGMLLKPIIAISLIAFIMTSILKHLKWFGLTGFSNSAKSKIFLILTSVLVFVVNLIWIYWVKDYNDTYGNHQNLMGVLPIWDMETSQILATLKLMKIKWGYQLYWPPVYLLMILSLAFMFIFRQKINKELFITTILLIVGQFCYILLYFDTYYHHDYYLINVIIAPLFIIISAIQALLTQEKVSWLKPATSIVLVLAIFMSFKHSQFIIQERYFGSLWEGVNKDLETVEPYLREIGVDRQDYVVSVPDRSPNISLYMMNQQGWTEIFNWEQNNMHHFAKRGAKYLIINDPAYLEKDPYKQYTYNKVGQYKSISVFKLDQDEN